MCRSTILTFTICNNKWRESHKYILEGGGLEIYFAYVLVYCLWHCCIVHKTTYYNIYVTLISLSGRCNCLQKKVLIGCSESRLPYFRPPTWHTESDLLMLSVTLWHEVRKGFDYFEFCSVQFRLIWLVDWMMPRTCSLSVQHPSCKWHHISLVSMNHMMALLHKKNNSVVRVVLKAYCF